jgi:hypothetical protein
MPTFDTPDPIFVTIDLVVGDARIRQVTVPTPSSTYAPVTARRRRRTRRGADQHRIRRRQAAGQGSEAARGVRQGRIGRDILIRRS